MPPRFTVRRMSCPLLFIAVVIVERDLMQPRTRVLANSFPAHTQRMSEMYGLLCGTSVSPGIIHTLDRTVQAVDKLEKTVADFVASTMTQFAGHSAKLDKIGDIVARHESRLNVGDQQKNTTIGYIGRTVFQGLIQGAAQIVIALVTLAMVLYRVHLPALH